MLRLGRRPRHQDAAYPDQMRTTSGRTQRPHRALLGCRVQIAAGDRRVLVARDPLQQVQFDASVGHPGECRVAQPVADQARQPEVLHELVPLRGVAQRAVVITPPRGPVTRRPSGSRPTVRRARVGLRGSRHRTASSSLGRLRDQAAATWVGLAPLRAQAVVEVDVADAKP
jgi:hypothetical protein